MKWFVFRVISVSVSLWEEFDKVFICRVDSQCIRALSWLSTLRPYYIVLRDVASLFYTEKRWDATSSDCRKYGLTSGDVMWSLAMLCLANCMLAALILWCLFTMYSRYCRRLGSFLVVCSCNSDMYSIRCTDVFSSLLKSAFQTCWKQLSVLNTAEEFCLFRMLFVHAWYVSCCCWYYYFERKKKRKM